MKLQEEEIQTKTRNPSVTLQLAMKRPKMAVTLIQNSIRTNNLYSLGMINDTTSASLQLRDKA